jgi:membrane-bound serine protease (ClpP class)
MTPGGMVLVQGERLHAESDGSLIAAGTEIEVFGVKGTRVLVRERSAPRDAEAAAPSPLAAGPGTAAGAAPSPLDFDFPHG